jgi:hypothetical protein
MANWLDLRLEGVGRVIHTPANVLERFKTISNLWDGLAQQHRLEDMTSLWPALKATHSCYDGLILMRNGG